MVVILRATGTKATLAIGPAPGDVIGEFPLNGPFAAKTALLRRYEWTDALTANRGEVWPVVKSAELVQVAIIISLCVFGTQAFRRPEVGEVSAAVWLGKAFHCQERIALPCIGAGEYEGRGEGDSKQGVDVDCEDLH